MGPTVFQSYSPLGKAGVKVGFRDDKTSRSCTSLFFQSRAHAQFCKKTRASVEAPVPSFHWFSTGRLDTFLLLEPRNDIIWKGSHFQVPRGRWEGWLLQSKKVLR